MKVNSFASRTIHVMPGQSVVTNGPYRMVRHPMYLGAAVMHCCFALELGSLVALLAFVLMLPLLVLRLLNEEELLRQELPGYTAYCQRTPFRLIPSIW
jgi:protein-S-isoprenylcysteine O-methyltransferase Ste14